MFSESFPAFLRDGERRVGASSDELFLALDISQFLKTPGMTG